MNKYSLTVWFGISIKYRQKKNSEKIRQAPIQGSGAFFLDL